jgi:hypothetical protein
MDDEPILLDPPGEAERAEELVEHLLAGGIADVGTDDFPVGDAAAAQGLAVERQPEPERRGEGFQ